MKIEGNINIIPLLKANDALKSALTIATTELEQAGAILYFEFCYELAWKTMRKILIARGKEVNSPKTVFREAALEGLIDDPTIWFAFIGKKNLTVHTYNLAVAKEIFNFLPIFAKELEKFINTLKP